MPRVRLSLVVLCLLVGNVAPIACAVSDDVAPVEGECLFGPTCVASDAGAQDATATQLDGALNVPQSDASLEGELCGTGQCVPDDPNSCSDFVGDAGDGDDPASTLDAGSSEDSGSLGDAALQDASEGGSSWDARADSGLPANEGAAYGCQVSLTAEAPEPRCAAAGNGEVMAPCIGQTDCAPGLACVGDPAAGRCLPYCCSGSEICAAGSYCASMPLLLEAMGTGSPSNARQVPVCAPADNCSLAEGFPCAGDDCVCLSGAACTVVRGDGTTSCVVPSQGRDGESCPCAAGYFCAPTSQTCLQICELVEETTRPCVSGRCQMAAGFPEGWGLCVGAATLP